MKMFKKKSWIEDREDFCRDVFALEGDEKEMDREKVIGVDL
jgi:hypothetical protein